MKEMLDDFHSNEIFFLVGCDFDNYVDFLSKNLSESEYIFITSNNFESDVTNKVQELFQNHFRKVVIFHKSDGTDFSRIEELKVTHKLVVFMPEEFSYLFFKPNGLAQYSSFAYFFRGV